MLVMRFTPRRRCFGEKPACVLKQPHLDGFVRLTFFFLAGFCIESRRYNVLLCNLWQSLLYRTEHARRPSIELCRYLFQNTNLQASTI